MMVFAKLFSNFSKTKTESSHNLSNEKSQSSDELFSLIMKSNSALEKKLDQLNVSVKSSSQKVDTVLAPVGNDELGSSNVVSESSPVVSSASVEAISMPESLPALDESQLEEDSYDENVSVPTSSPSQSSPPKLSPLSSPTNHYFFDRLAQMIHSGPSKDIGKNLISEMKSGVISHISTAMTTEQRTDAISNIDEQVIILIKPLQEKERQWRTLKIIVDAKQAELKTLESDIQKQTESLVELLQKKKSLIEYSNDSLISKSSSLKRKIPTKSRKR